MHTKEEKLAAFGRLLDLMDELREKCPWNAAQTMESIRPMTEEEVYELSDAIVRGDRPSVAKEIGDLLYHMVFYARIAQEEGSFDIADSIGKVCDKMVFRHPHVFGDTSGRQLTAKEIADTWELVKAKEKDGNKTVMSGIPDAMPAILKALSMQEKARGCGFDWKNREDVWSKVDEELGEVSETCCLHPSMPPVSTESILKRHSALPAVSSAAVSAMSRRLFSRAEAALPKLLVRKWTGFGMRASRKEFSENRRGLHESY